MRKTGDISIFSVVPRTHFYRAGHLCSLSQACSEKGDVSMEKRHSNRNSTFRNAVEILNKIYFISLLSSQHNLSYWGQKFKWTYLTKIFIQIGMFVIFRCLLAERKHKDKRLSHPPRELLLSSRLWCSLIIQGVHKSRQCIIWKPEVK